MWHYIYVLFFFQKIKKNHGFPGFLKKSKYCQFGCGTMWHYVALYLCFVFFKKEKMMVFKEIEKNIKILKILMWHYVAQCGTIFMYCFFKKTKKNDGFPGFKKKSKYCQFGCGTM